MKETTDKDSSLSKKMPLGGGGDSWDIKIAVYAIVDYHIPEYVYECIDKGMTRYWETRRMDNGYFHEDHLKEYINKYLSDNHILYPASRVDDIIDAVIWYLAFVGRITPNNG